MKQEEENNLIVNKLLTCMKKLYRGDMNWIEVIVILLLKIFKHENISIGKRGQAMLTSKQTKSRTMVTQGRQKYQLI